MVSTKLLELENSIQNLSLEEKLWLLEKIVAQVRSITEDAKAKQEQKLADIKYDSGAKPIWEIAVEIGAKIPESEWEKVPRDLSKNLT
ncbi:MAG: hypothetical protein SXA11_02315 [Cyanobacteriota bacterium]|nr:hypothetical protein [Cyanobacteriota bacterium]